MSGKVIVHLSRRGQVPPEYAVVRKRPPRSARQRARSSRYPDPPAPQAPALALIDRMRDGQLARERDRALPVLRRRNTPRHRREQAAALLLAADARLPAADDFPARLSETRRALGRESSRADRAVAERARQIRAAMVGASTTPDASR
jgi:hypothetical protein